MPSTARSAAIPWIAAGRTPRDARLRLFCLPYAGGGASIFHRWVDALGPSIDVRAVQPPGREQRLPEQPFHSLEPLVAELAEAMEPWLTLPYALFGSSMGALIAFEAARQLSATPAGPPVKLLVAARGAPHVPDPGPELHRLPDGAFVQAIRRLHGTPDEVFEHGELRALLLPLLRADFTLCETYRYRERAPLDAPIVAFGGQQDDTVSRSDLEAWRELTRSSFTLRMLPGGHFFVHSAREALLSAIADELSSSRRATRELRPW
jgi:surfactin synthase thioesterase subunit